MKQLITPKASEKLNELLTEKGGVNPSFTLDQLIQGKQQDKENDDLYLVTLPDGSVSVRFNFNPEEDEGYEAELIQYTFNPQNPGLKIEALESNEDIHIYDTLWISFIGDPQSYTDQHDWIMERTLGWLGLRNIKIPAQPDPFALVGMTVPKERLERAIFGNIVSNYLLCLKSELSDMAQLQFWYAMHI